MTAAVILAGGSGRRAGGSVPKQFLQIAGKMVIEHTLDAFERNDLIDEICVVCNPDYVYLMEEIKGKGNYSKLGRILFGGKERYISSLKAINAYSDQDKLVFHDAVRPLVSQRIITQTVEALYKWRAVGVAIKTTDTIIDVGCDGGNIMHSILDRSVLCNAQTPQAFWRDVIKKAYDIALKDVGFKATDDCGVVKKYLPEESIFVVQGERENIKITYEKDIFLCGKLLELREVNCDLQ